MPHKEECPQGHNAMEAEEIVNFGDGPWSQNLRTATPCIFFIDCLLLKTCGIF